MMGCACTKDVLLLSVQLLLLRTLESLIYFMLRIYECVLFCASAPRLIFEVTVF
jgi:hypothetical protein